MFADYSAEIKIAIFQPFRNTNVTYKDRPKIAGAWRQKIARFNSVNSEITGRKLTKFGKKVQIRKYLSKYASFLGCVIPDVHK